MVKVHLQNHSSVIIEIGEVKLLTDPWYMGYCFDGGWGLQYNNSEAFQNVETCNFLWISHFHPDHFHVPTLKRILEINPNIKVIGNNSYNFQMDEAVRKIGFKNIIPFGWDFAVIAIFSLAILYLAIMNRATLHEDATLELDERLMGISSI